MYRDPTNCLPCRSPEVLSTLFGTPVRHKLCCTNYAVEELALPHLTLDGRAVTPGEARNSKCFRALLSSQIIACMHHRKWWKSRWKKALCLGFSCLSFYSQMPGSAPTTATTCCLFPTQATLDAIESQLHPVLGAICASLSSVSREDVDWTLCSS